MYSTFPVSSHISAYCHLRPLELERLLLSERRVNISGRITAHVAPNTSHRHSSASALLRCYGATIRCAETLIPSGLNAAHAFSPATAMVHL